MRFPGVFPGSSPELLRVDSTRESQCPRSWEGCSSARSGRRGERGGQGRPPAELAEPISAGADTDMNVFTLALLVACTKAALPQGEGRSDPADDDVSAPPAGSPGFDEPPWGQRAPALGEVEASWRQGDDIPGWEDFPCEDLGEPRVRRFVDQAISEENLESLVDVGGRHTWGCPVERPVMIKVNLRSLGVDAEGEPETKLYASTIGSYFDPPEPRGQGWYAREREGDCRLNSRVPSAAIRWRNESPQWVDEECGHEENNGWSLESWVHICYSRVRPDQIRGTVWAQPVPWAAGGSAWYSEWGWVVVDFEVDFPPRAGMRWDQYDEVLPILPPDFYEHPYFGYQSPEETESSCGDADYDSAWPWEDITDPLIRDIVYQRYRPWSVDDLPAEGD